MYLADHLEREYDIISQVRGAMIYPAFVVCVLIAVVLIVMFSIMPRLVDLIKQTTAKPPFFTLMMINFYGFLQNFGWVVIVGFLLLILFLFYYFTTKEGRKNYDKVVLKTPLLGGFLKKVFLIRFAENVSTLISAGLTINNALKITKDTVENFVYKQILAEAEERVSGGEKISSVLSKYPNYAPPFVVQMVQVGEETGKLDKNLMEIVNFYQKEVNRAVATFTALLEPVLIIFLGIIVAILAISVIEPLYRTLETI
jgi:type IV pilus assembly protein PilC